MSRAHRLPGGGGVFHLTHRCHNRAFLVSSKDCWWGARALRSGCSRSSSHGKKPRLLKGRKESGPCGRLDLPTAKKRARKARHSLTFNDSKMANIQMTSNLIR